MRTVGCVLIISPENWSAHAVSKHHYAIALAKLGYRIFFLDPPDGALSNMIISAHPGYPCLSTMRGPRVARGLRFYPSVLRRWLESRWLMRFEHLAGHAIDTIWLFENSRFFDMSFAGDRLKIYHQVDLNQDFHPEMAAATADICFCTTDFIRHRLLPFNPFVYKI